MNYQPVKLLAILLEAALLWTGQPEEPPAPKLPAAALAALEAEHQCPCGDECDCPPGTCPDCGNVEVKATKPAQQPYPMTPAKGGYWTGPKGVMFRTTAEAIEHLEEHDARFKTLDLSSLNLSQLNALHSDLHTNSVKWVDGIPQQVKTVTKPVTRPIITYQQWMQQPNCPNGNCPQIQRRN